MLVMKFGGSSVRDADRMRNAATLVARETGPVVVVTSAMGGVTDELIAIGDAARAGRRDDVTGGLGALRQRHEEAAAALAGDDPATADRLARVIDEHLHDLERLLQGISLVQEISPRTADLLVSFGERLAAPLLAAAIADRGADAEAVDARPLIRTSNGSAAAAGPGVDMVASRALTRAALAARATDTVPVVTGFIASDAAGVTTTLGRGGSDYTATLVGAFLDADAIWIWTDVDGIMTADPRVVPEARVLPRVTYREAAEMAYFGSKVLHPRTMIPAVEQHIPVTIRNTLNPDHPGTLITHEPVPSRLGVKTVSSVAHLALVTIEGNGMVGVPGIMQRIFSATAATGANVYMVSQASSEHNISFAVHEQDGTGVVAALETAFEVERARGQIDRIDVLAPVGIVAVIGEGMKGTPGIAQRMFTALGRGRINVLAIAQGSSELNLSVVVHGDELRRAVGAVHSSFGLTRDTHLFLMGKGLVGRALLRQIVAARRRLMDDAGIGLPVIGVCGRDELLFDVAGIDDERLTAIADGAGLRSVGGVDRPDDATLLAHIARSRWLDVIIVDLTAEEMAPLHADALAHGLHVVTANKKPMAGSLATHRTLLAAAADHGVSYRFETTFGAGLPALSTLQELRATGDTIHRITGCLSGTLGFLCSSLDAGQSFSACVRAAMDLGYTEPDPRDDLNGADVARKALIIARQLGAALEPEEVALEGMMTDALAAAADPEAFLAALPGADASMAERVQEARAAGGVLRYMAEMTPTGATVGLRTVPRDSAAGQLDGPDNILVFETERYHDHPLVIRGPGAGAEVTAAGVLGDILKIVRAT